MNGKEKVLLAKQSQINQPSAALDTSNIKKAELVPLLVNAAVKIATVIGKEERTSGELGTHLVAEFDGMTILYRTPKAMIFTAPSVFGIDVWHGSKCFSVNWNSKMLRDFQIVSFKRGPWIPALLDYSDRMCSPDPVSASNG